MIPWIYTLSIMAFVCWAFSMYVFWQYQVRRISLLGRLGIIRTDEKKKKKWSDNLKAIVFRWSQQLSPLGKRFRFFINEKDLPRKIALAGHPHGLDVDSFYGFRFLCLFIGLFLGTVLSWLGFGGIVEIAFIVMGLFFPQIWLRSTAARRQEQIGYDLPEFMDTMSVTLQAGVPMDPAIQQICKHMDGPLSEELNRFQQELDIGVPREEAYLRLMNRNQCKELETLILSLVQGSKLGVPIANTFKVLAEDMRQTRVNKIKEKAAKAGPKVTLITTFVILPAVILCIMGLLVLNFIYNPGGIGISWDDIG